VSTRDEYRVPTAAGRAELRRSASRFFAHVAPAGSIAEAKEMVTALARRYSDATHVCFGWRIGWPPAERAADAGEPRGTAGAPILQALRAAGLSDVVAAVVRYYGGTKLGKGGLARAYGDCVRLALEALPARVCRPRAVITVECAPDAVGAVKRLLRPGRIELVGERYGARARLEVAVVLEERAAFESALAGLRLTAAGQSQG
jgi:uncharacterized YigZ family protein